MLCIDYWITPDQFPKPPVAGELDLWLIDLEPAFTPDPSSLSEAEQIRAARIVQAKYRDRFVAVRCAVRTILAGYLEEVPEAIRFGHSAMGKPYLEFPTPPLHFNLSHSHTRALLAVFDQDVGIDLEQERPRRNLRRIARKLFDEQILTRLDAMPDEIYTKHFFHHWTELEARAKAVGEGVFTFDQSRKDIQCTGFSPLPGWCAAVATSGTLPPETEWRTFHLTSDIGR